jgi:hypothetical protein
MIASKTIALIAAMSLLGSVAPAAFAETTSALQINALSQNLTQNTATVVVGDDDNDARSTANAAQVGVQNNNNG